MPIVFVHGVNNRQGDDYRDNEAGRNGFLREIVAPALGLDPDKLSLVSPYWGGDAASFAWEMAVLPNPDEDYEAFGGADDALAHGRTVDLIAESPIEGDLVESARRDFGATVDLVYAAALAGATTEEQARDLATSYLRASAYAEENPSPDWLDNVTEENFADVLNLKAEASADESFGGGGVLDFLKEGASRLVSALPDAGSALAGRLARKKLNTTLTRFAGDAFVYLKERGSKDEPGPIVKSVLDALRAADAARTAADDKLVVIAHSFGGEIVYDVLTTFAPDLQVDCLVTVGSQVGLFEELKLYVASDDAIPPDPKAGKVPRPANLKRWLNVFDTNDVLAYRTSPVFAESDDFAYDTGYSSLDAHGGYFMRPSFYKRLAARLLA
jgi:hypothetical protein